MAARVIDVAESASGERLDVFLARELPELSRARAKAMIDRGAVSVGGRTRTKSYRIRAGDRIELVELPEPVDFHCTPDPALDLVVLIETDDFVIVDKPAGVPSHPLGPEERGTLAGALVARYPEMREVGYRKREPGILHRLDTGTSGVMLAARNERAFGELREELRAGRIEKRYLARCVGEVEAPRIIDAPIANDPRDRRKVRACSDPREIRRLGAQSARTEILASTRSPGGTLVEVRANHARRHQIRVHLAHIGHPLLGDVLYGGPVFEAATHHLLHASMIRVGTVHAESTAWKYGTF